MLVDHAHYLLQPEFPSYVKDGKGRADQVTLEEWFLVVVVDTLQ